MKEVGDTITIKADDGSQETGTIYAIVSGHYWVNFSFGSLAIRIDL